MITLKRVFVSHAGVDKPYDYEKHFVVSSPEEAIEIAHQHECVYFRDTDAPHVRGRMLTPLAVYGRTPQGFTRLTENSFKAWKETRS